MNYVVLAVLLALLLYMLRRKRTAVECTITHLAYYPVKACKPTMIQSGEVNLGFKYDREWAVIDAEGKIVNYKTNPKITGIQPTLNFEGDTATSMKLEYPGQPSVVFDLVKEPTEAAPVYGEGTVTDEGDKAAAWLQSVFDQPYRLKRLATARRLRVSDPAMNSKEDDRISFSMSGNFLIVTEESFAQLQRELPPYKQEELIIWHFRPNIIVKGARAFDENDWYRVQVGEVIVEASGKCKRCMFTTINFDRMEFDPKNEPVKTLQRINGDGRSGFFGVEARQRSFGRISVGDSLRVLKRKELKRRE